MMKSFTACLFPGDICRNSRPMPASPVSVFVGRTQRTSAMASKVSVLPGNVNRTRMHSPMGLSTRVGCDEASDPADVLREAHVDVTVVTAAGALPDLISRISCKLPA